MRWHLIRLIGRGILSAVDFQYFFNHNLKSGGDKTIYEIIVDSEKCMGCGECVDICPSEVYELQDDKSVPVNAEECVGCESCVEVCEQGTITVREFGEAAA